MKEFMCHTKCYYGSLYRPGDSIQVEASTMKAEPPKEGEEPSEDFKLRTLLESHFELTSDDSKPVTNKDPEAAVKALLKKAKIKATDAEAIFEKAGANEPHEKLRALNAYIEMNKKD